MMKPVGKGGFWPVFELTHVKGDLKCIVKISVLPFCNNKYTFLSIKKKMLYLLPQTGGLVKHCIQYTAR